MNHVIEYSVDSSGEILNISGNWDVFLNDNDGKLPSSISMTGKNLFDFIKGDEVIEVYKTFHSILKKYSSRTISFDYRCDSPFFKRFMQMDIRNTGGVIIYRSSILREEKHTQPFVIDYNTDEGEIVVMCAWCKDFRYPNTKKTWNPIENIFSSAPDSFLLSHSICDDCIMKFEK